MTPIQAAYRAKIARDTLPRGQRPTDLHVRIMFVLARWQHATPSHAKLAKAAHCHRNSVGNALRRLRGLGLVTWEPRHIRIGGGHFAQASNHYLFPSNTSLPPARPAKIRKDGKMSSFIGKQSLCIGDPEAAQAALAARRRVMEARMLAEAELLSSPR
jgi:DNA-binding transcriptional MocR family regulator